MCVSFFSYSFLQQVVECLTEISQSSEFNRDARSDAVSLLHGITDYSYIVTLVLTHKVISYLKGLTVSLQKPSLDVGYALKQVSTVKTTLQEVNKIKLCYMPAQTTKTHWSHVTYEYLKSCTKVAEFVEIALNCVKLHRV